MRITEAFRRYGVELSNPQWTSSAVSESSGEIILSLWSHAFSSDMAKYQSGTAHWKGAGKPIFYRHLRQSLDEGLPIRVVVASTKDPNQVVMGNATRADNDFNPEFALVGRVVRLEANEFELAFELTGSAPSQEIARRSRASVKYWHVAEAVEALGTPTSSRDVQSWLSRHYPGEDHSDLGANLSFLTVNDTNRRHYDRGRKVWRTDMGHPRDRLFRRGRQRATTYEPFLPGVHGHWDLRPTVDGIWEAVPLPATLLGRAEAQANANAFEHLPSLASDHDARVWALTAVVQRQGQGTFRTKLLDAYNQRCAITGCTAVAVLEAAHILPYRGEHTHRVDNGLLLRSDVHTLFDLGLIWITDVNEVSVSPVLNGSEYAEYEGQALSVPARPEHRPNPDHLAQHARVALERQQ